MEDYSFYKSKFDRELSRRTELDNAINNPILGITIITGLISYIITNSDFNCWNAIDYIVICLLIISVLSITFALVFIFLSYNNLLIGFKYFNFGLLKEYREVQKELDIFNQSLPVEKRKDFEIEIVEKIISFADNHTIINDKRALHLYRAKTFIIIAFVLIATTLIIVTINNFVNHG